MQIATYIPDSIAGLRDRSASDIDSGTLADARLSSNVPLLNKTNVFAGHVQVPSLTSIGALAATALIDVWGSSYSMIALGGSNKTIKLSTDGTDVLTVSADGRVGIGTTTPNRVLEVKGTYPVTLYNRAGSYFWEAGVSDGEHSPQSAFHVRDFSLDKVRLLIAHTTGYVGIGTTEPAAALHVDTDVSNGYAGYIVASGNYSNGLDVLYGGNRTDKIAMRVRTAGGATLLIANTDGTVGIGTSTPTGRLHVVGDVDYTLLGPGALIVEDSTAMASSVGGAVVFRGNFTGTTSTTAGAIRAYKENATAGQWGFGLKLFTRENGESVLTEVMDIEPNGVVNIPKVIDLPVTTDIDIGVIRKGGNRFMHDFRHPTGDTAVPLGQNVFLGEAAGNFTMGSTATSSTQASNNLGIGYHALMLLTTGYGNTAVGSSALDANTIGDNNTAIGTSALATNISGCNNFALGSAALAGNTTGDCSIGIGIYALLAATGGANVSIGHNSGRSVVAASANTFLGYYAGFHASQKVDAYNSTAIGNDTYTTKDNQVVIGDVNVIETLLRGYVGIGMTPAVPLDVAGTVRATDAFQVYNGMVISKDGSDNAILRAWTSGRRTEIRDGSSNTGLVVADGGAVGVGLVAPTAALHVKAGTATAGTAPVKLTEGVNLAVVEAGAFEWDGTDLHITQTDGPTRKTLATTDLVHIPYGLPSFRIYASASYYNDDVKEEFTLDGNFTFVKRFNARISAVASQFLDVSNAAGDRIQVRNSGYSTIVTVTVGGVELYTDTAASSILFPTLTDTIFTVEVDYDNEEIRLTTGAPTDTTHAITGLSDLKESVFTSLNIGVNAYGSGCMYSFITKGLYAYAARAYILNDLSDYPLIVVMGKTVHDIVAETPTRFAMSDLIKEFSDGSVTFSYAELDALATGSNKYGGHASWVDEAYNRLVFDTDLVHYTKESIITYGFSITVENASVYFKSPTTSLTQNVRLIEKNLGTIIDSGEVASNDEFEIPVGEWWAELTGTCRFPSYGLNTLNYLLGWGSVDATATMTLFDDAVMRPTCIVFSAIPQMATYLQGYCPFTEQYAEGNWSLAAEYN